MLKIIYSTGLNGLAITDTERHLTCFPYFYMNGKIMQVGCSLWNYDQSSFLHFAKDIILGIFIFLILATGFISSGNQKGVPTGRDLGSYVRATKGSSLREAVEFANKRAFLQDTIGFICSCYQRDLSTGGDCIRMRFFDEHYYFKNPFIHCINSISFTIDHECGCLSPLER